MLSFRVHQDGSNACFPISLVQKLADISLFEIWWTIENFMIFHQNLKITIKIRKNRKIARLNGTSNLNFWMNIGRNNFEKRAFEPPWCPLIENKKIFDPASIPFDFWYNWGSIFFENWETYKYERGYFKKLLRWGIFSPPTFYKLLCFSKTNPSSSRVN